MRNKRQDRLRRGRGGETARVAPNGQPIADIVPAGPVTPAWKKPPLARLALPGLSLSDEVLADRDTDRREAFHF